MVIVQIVAEGPDIKCGSLCDLCFNRNSYMCPPVILPHYCTLELSQISVVGKVEL